MIKVQTIDQVSVAARLLRDMYIELHGDDCSTDILDYRRYIHNYEHVYIGDNDECLLLLKDITPKLLPITTKLWDGEAVYIIPEKRRSRTLAMMYKFMFDNFEGEVVGMVHPDSLHNEVVAKRGNYVGTVYSFNKETFRKDI